MQSMYSVVWKVVHQGAIAMRMLVGDLTELILVFSSGSWLKTAG